MDYDKIIIGAGIFGLYSALYCARNNEKVLVLEKEKEAFSRATYINQARVHMGYHYPRSLKTAQKTIEYFERFNYDFGFSILSDFKQIYATSSNFSWTNASQFKKFCRAANIEYEEISPDKYFRDKMCDGAFLTKEYTYDAIILKKYFLEELAKFKNVNIIYESRIDKIEQNGYCYEIYLNNTNKDIFRTDFLLNCTYAGTNEILDKLGFEKFKIKYELCEVILCDANDKFKDIGITMMDGPFFSIMPFGKTGLHSLTTVSFTPHESSYDSLPTFECQKRSNGKCEPDNLANCNECSYRPKSSSEYMGKLVRKYMKDTYDFNFKSSLYSVKPIFNSSEIDDSRPTIIKQFTKNPTFISVLSGKVSTIYDLDEVLKNDK